MASFVSADKLESERKKRKEQRKIARKEILEEAKESFMKQKKKRELKEERGDDKWIAPGIEQRLSEYSYVKKQKKHKKQKKSKRRHHDAISDKSDEELWVEKPQENSDETTLTISETTPTINEGSRAEPLARQEWMTLPLESSLATKRLQEEEIRKKPKMEEDSIGRHPLELNPYWKNGGRGLPEEDGRNGESSKSMVGDGGRSWLLRSYKRALERSQEEGISMEQIAEEKWGSLEQMYSLLEGVDIDPSDPDGYKGDRRGGKQKKSYLYVGKDTKDEVIPSTTKTRPLERPSYQPFKPTRGFVKPGEGSSVSPHGYHGNIGSTSQSWLKNDSHRHDTPPEEPATPIDEPSMRHKSPTPPPVLSKEVAPVTDAQLNSLGAKLVKAEMIGDKNKIEKLKKKLDELREIQSQQKSMKGSNTEKQQTGVTKKEEEVLLITTTDRYGHTRPLNQQQQAQKYPSLSTKDKRNTHTDKGKRKKYFSNDDQYSLRDLVEQERISTAEETHLAIAKMASKFVPSRNFDETVDDVLDNQTVLKEDPQKQQKKAEMRAMHDTRALNEALKNCKLCVGTESFDKHLLVALGIEVYLAVPSEQPLTEGHCCLIPREHTPCSLQMDENVWSEVAIFRKGLTKMFADRDMDVVFMEMYGNVNNKRHMVIECVPIPKETGELAPMYFKKAIMESDTEWSDNKKLVDTSSKGVRGSLPKGLPYFFVEFGTDGGYGHVIEDQSKFPWYFGREVCGGMLDCEPRLWLKPQRDSFERQKLRVLQLSSWWNDYDWTQKINQ